MKRPVVLIVGAAAGALLIAGIGASAHTGLFLTQVGVHQGFSGDEASGARTESPEPTDTPEASPTPEPTDQPEAPPTAEPAEAPDASDEDGDSQGTSGDQQSGAASGSGDSAGTGQGD